MEHEGLVRALNFLEQKSITVGTLTADRHKQITRYVREVQPDIQHQYDAWPISKGIKKKLARLSTNKDCSIISEWIKSIINHLCWCTASAPEGDGNDIVKRWKSIMDHICDDHCTCYHKDLTLEERRKKWLIPSTKPYEKLSDIILSPYLHKALEKLSPVYQTSSLEAYHSMVNHFAPKLLGFLYTGIYCRLLMAALHFNENYNRVQAKTASGSEQIRIVCPKHKQGEFTPKPVPVPKTYDYVDKLMKKAVHYCLTDEGKPTLPSVPCH